MRPGVELQRTCPISVRRWIGHWWFLCAWSHVYRRDRSCQISRSPGGFLSFNVVFGILLAYFSNYVIGLFNLGDHEWRWKLGIAAVPAVLFFLALFGIPRSPRWVAKKNRLQEAREVLRMTGEENFEQELKEIVESVDLEHATGEPLFSWKYRLPIFLAGRSACSISSRHQCHSVYLNDIFAYVGFSKVSGDSKQSSST
jgi:MFS transporter, SP family, arabinose:H+ symporter